MLLQTERRWLRLESEIFIVGPATNSLFWLVPGFRALMRVVEKEKPPSVVDL